jgi:hypothetical protein
MTVRYLLNKSAVRELYIIPVHQQVALTGYGQWGIGEIIFYGEIIFDKTARIVKPGVSLGKREPVAVESRAGELHQNIFRAGRFKLCLFLFFLSLRPLS